MGGFSILAVFGGAGFGALLRWWLAAWLNPIFPTIPPRVDYELTDLGRGLAQPVQALGQWAFEHLPEIEGARTNFDTRNDKG